jgi:AcrR family transcriptional regulator
MAPRGTARLAILRAAERLFAERGIEAVSLRDVSAAAGQRNHSAAQYHFGDRGQLVAAVFEARMEPINERRHQMLDELVGDDPAALVGALVSPLVEAVAAEADGWYARFLARARWDTMAAEVLADHPSATSVRELNRRLARRLAEAPAVVRLTRIEQLHTLVVGTLAGWEWARARGERRLDPAHLAAELGATGLAVLTAPITQRQGAPSS